MLNSEEISADKIKSGIGGYKKKDTKEFIDAIRNEYEALCKENLELKDKIGVLSEGVQYYKNMEKSLQKALVLAERTTSETVHAAEVKALAMEKEAQARAEVLKKEAKVEAEAYEKEAAAKANQMIRDAKAQADLAISEGNEELRRIHSQIMTLIQQYEQYKTQYKQLAMAQMNVLESEAYNLDAPILKTLQKGIKKEEDVHKEHEVVKPVQASKKMPEDHEETKEKKVYVDARGDVVEVHEFREVTLPNSGQDPFAENEEEEENNFGESLSKGVERFDDEDDMEHALDKNYSIDQGQKMSSTCNAMNMDDLVLNHSWQDKKVDVQDTDKLVSEEENLNNSAMEYKVSDETPNEEKAKVSMADGWMPDVMEDALKGNDFNSASTKSHLDDTKLHVDNENAKDEVSSPVYSDMKEIQQDVPEQTEKKREISNAAMREIERMQLERLRQEEQRHTEELQRSQERKSYFSVGAKTAENRVSEKDFFENVTFKQERPEISLHEIKKQDDEWKEQVPLPKASQENLYFSDSFENLKASSPDETKQVTSSFLDETKQEKKKGTFFEQFADDTENTRVAYDSDENRNSLDFQMDHAETMPSEKYNDGGFKSFRDFESEL